MKPNRIGVTALAAALDIPAARLLGILVGHQPVTSETAKRMARHFDTTDAFWLNLEANYARSRGPRPRRRRSPAE